MEVLRVVRERTGDGYEEEDLQIFVYATVIKDNGFEEATVIEAINQGR